MKWQKRGLVFAPRGDRWWARGYAHLPTACNLNDEVIRVYFAALDENNYGRVGYVDLAADDPKRILYESPEPVLDLGEIGTFEDCGVVPSCVIRRDGRFYLYYHGFQRTERVPYLIFTGLAVADSADGPFRRHSRTPILDRSAEEPFLRGAPAVVTEDGLFRMWYVSGLRWTKTNAHLHYENVIRHATSRDGVCWKVDEHVCLRPDLPDEYSVGRPAVVRDESGYHMWFSARSHSRLYRIGYAWSRDGVHWARDDSRAGIDKSAEGWDSEVICYASLLRVRGKWHLFYNGNRHGASGFGYAVGA